MTRFGLRRRLLEEDGSSTVEFALSSVVLFLTMLGIMEISLAMYSDHITYEAAREGSRYAMGRYLHGWRRFLHGYGCGHSELCAGSGLSRDQFAEYDSDNNLCGLSDWQHVLAECELREPRESGNGESGLCVSLEHSLCAGQHAEYEQLFIDGDFAVNRTANYSD